MTDCPLAPKPASRPDKVSLFRHLMLFRKDIFTSQPAKLYRAKMAQFRTPFFRSYLINEPDLIKTVLKVRPQDFPKSAVIGDSLRSLLGNSVFVTNGETWLRQRRIIDPAFSGGRLHTTFPSMVAAGQNAIARIGANCTAKPVEMEEQASHMAADVIFRTLFSVAITETTATEVFHAFRDYQRTQPLLNLASFVPLPRWVPRFHRPKTLRTSRKIRRLLTELTAERAALIAKGAAPDDLATKIMTTADPRSQQRLSTAEMVDQVAIFFLAGHETSASALAWALYLIALDPKAQDRLAAEAKAVFGANDPDFSMIKNLTFTRDVFREALRLYPPVPMMLRSNLKPEQFRNRDIKVGAHIVVSPWHLHRHTRLWDSPDRFDPTRWQTENGKTRLRDAWIPFSAGPRICPGSGFAMVEGVLLLAMLARAFRFETIDGDQPVPVAHLTVRAKNGIRLRVTPRDLNDLEARPQDPHTR